jgi:branched-chain amino acid transport system substrate-binding protein
LCDHCHGAGTIAITGAQAADVAGVTDTEIKVGSFGPLTGPGYIYGKLTMNGVEVYFNELNRRGGVHGRKLVLVREDDLCKPEGGIAAVKKLVVRAHRCSPSSAAGAPTRRWRPRPEIEKGRRAFPRLCAVADGIVDPASNHFIPPKSLHRRKRAQNPVGARLAGPRSSPSSPSMTLGPSALRADARGF